MLGVFFTVKMTFMVDLEVAAMRFSHSVKQQLTGPAFNVTVLRTKVNFPNVQLQTDEQQRVFTASLSILAAPVVRPWF